MARRFKGREWGDAVAFGLIMVVGAHNERHWLSSFQQ